MDTEQRAEPGSLKVGDMVSWNSSGVAPAENLADRHRWRIDGPDSSITVTGTPDDPAARPDFSRRRGHRRHVGHKFSTLTKERAQRSADKLLSKLIQHGDLYSKGVVIPSSADAEARTVEVIGRRGHPCCAAALAVPITRSSA